MSNTKVPGDLIANVRTLGEFILRDKAEAALGSAQTGIWGAKATQLLPALQQGLASFTQAAGIGAPDFSRFGAEIGGASSSGSPPDEVVEIVQGALPVAYALANTDGTTYEVFKQVSDLLKIKPVQVENVPTESLGSVGQSLMTMAEDLKKITNHVAPHVKGGGPPGPKGHGQTPLGFREIKPGTAIRSSTRTYVGPINAMGGSGAPYSATVSPAGGTIGVVPTSPSQFMLVATCPANAHEATATITLTDTKNNSASIVVIVDFDAVEERRETGGKPSLVPLSSGVLDGSKGVVQSREFVASGAPAGFDVFAVTGATAPTQPPAPGAGLPLGWTIEPDEDGDSRGTRIKVRFAVSAFPTAATAAPFWVGIASHGNVVAAVQGQYVNPPPAAQLTGLASRWIELGSTITVNGSNLQTVASPHLQFLDAKGVLQATIPLQLQGDALVGSVDDIAAGVYNVQLTSGDPPLPSGATYPLGSVTLANPVATAVAFTSLQIESGQALTPSDSTQVIVPANASKATIQMSVAKAVPGAIAYLQDAGDPDQETLKVGVATSASSTMQLNLDAKVCANPATYTVLLKNPQPVSDARVAPAAVLLTVAIAPPTVISASSSSDGHGKETIAITGANFLPESSLDVTFYEGNKQIDVDVSTSIDSATRGTITFVKSMNITSVSIVVTNKANGKSSVDVASQPPYVIAGKDLARPVTTQGSRPRSRSHKAALTDDIVEIVGSTRGRAHVLELIAERLEDAGLGGDAVHAFEGQLTVLRTLDRHALHERVQHILSTL